MYLSAAEIQSHYREFQDSDGEGGDKQTDRLARRRQSLNSVRKEKKKCTYKNYRG